jgi:hypothetical protein
MASAGTVTLDLDANSVKLLQELQKAQNRTKSAANNMSASMGKAFSSIAKSAAVIGTALAGALAAATKSSINAADALSKQAQATGIAIEELSALKYAADLSGVSFQSLTSSMGKFNRNMVEAAKGTGAAQDAFKALGISVTNSDGSLKTSTQVMGEVADRFAGLEDGAAKSALAMDIFGKSGAQMIPMLNTGSAGIKAMADEAERLGLVIDQKTGTAAEQFNDAITKLKLSFTGLGNKLMVDALPYLQQFSDWVSNPANQQAVASMARGIADIATVAARAAMSVAGATRSLLELVGIDFDDLKGLNKQLDDVEKKILNMQKYHRDPAQLMASKDADRFMELLEEQERIRAAIKDATRDMAEAPIIPITRGALDIEDMMPEGDDPMDKFRQSAQKAFDATRSGLERAVADFAEFQIAVDTLGSDALTGMGINVEQVFARMRENIGQEMDKMKGDTKETAETMNQYMIQASRNMQDAFAQFLFDPFEDGIKGMLKSFVDALRRMVAQAMAAKILTTLAGMSNPLGAFISMGLPSRDSGGRGAAGQPYMIGKKAQPEIFIPDSAGTFIPNADSLGGNTSFNISIDARDPGAEGRIRSMIQDEMAPQIIEAATGRTMNMLRRPRFA